MDMHTESAKWQQRDAADDAPSQQPMRGNDKAAPRRKPDAEQKKVRREMQRSAFSREEFGQVVKDEYERLQSAHSSPAKSWNGAEAASPSSDGGGSDSSSTSGSGGSSATAIADKPGGWDRNEIAGVAECDRCGQMHPGEYHHEGQWGQGPIFAVTCPEDGLTQFHTLEGLEPTPKPKRRRKGLEMDLSGLQRDLDSGGHSTTGSLRCLACGCGRDGGPACRMCGSAMTSAMTREATTVSTNVASSDGTRVLIQPGDSIRTPTGQTVKVKQIRRHETSRDHYYMDTDAGTSVVPWSTSFDVTPSNQSQQALPGTGVPGGNFNSMPLNPQAGGEAGTTATPGECPSCGAKGTLNRRGGKFQCSRCGYTDNPVGPGMSFSDSTQTIMANPRTSAITGRDTRSAIARRASAVIDATKEIQ